MRMNFAVVWAASFFFLKGGCAFTGESSYHHLFLRSCPNPLFGVSKGLQFHTMPVRTTGGNITQLGDHRRLGNTHINHIKHHMRTRTRTKFTTRPAFKLLQGVFPRKILVPLTKNSQKPPQKQNTLTSSFDCLRFVLFFLLFSFPLCTLFFFILLGFCRSFFFTVPPENICFFSPPEKSNSNHANN